MEKTVLITGITGQDGYYLAKNLLESGHRVHGTIRRTSSINTYRIDELISKYSKDGFIKLHYSDLTDSASISNLITNINPDEVFNLAAQSHVAVSFKNPVYTTQVGTLGSLSVLEAIRSTNKFIKFYQASSSEMFGGEDEVTLNEESLFDPKSPYAASKVFAHHMTRIYRESYDMFCVNGILFNHESPLRGETFVTRKISRAVGRIVAELQDKLTLGNLDASRDWGFAGDYVLGMIKMMNHSVADDWVLSTGETHTVREFVETAFSYVNLNWEDYVLNDSRYNRPNEVHYLKGDSSKAHEQLGWKPELSFSDLVKLMVDQDIELANQEKVLIERKLIEPTWEHSKV
jgi:GDPmannose 4,6-dehydratase